MRTKTEGMSLGKKGRQELHSPYHCSSSKPQRIQTGNSETIYDLHQDSEKNIKQHRRLPVIFFPFQLPATSCDLRKWICRIISAYNMHLYYKWIQLKALNTQKPNNEYAIPNHFKDEVSGWQRYRMRNVQSLGTVMAMKRGVRVRVIIFLIQCLGNMLAAPSF